MHADLKILGAVRRVNLESSLLAMLVEGMNTHGADSLTATITLGANHEPADIDLTFTSEGMPLAGESL